jgi:RNA polymerase sigma-70 factor (ECF subfamily)
MGAWWRRHDPADDDADGLSDRLMLERFLRGDRAAFDDLFRRHAPRVHATAWRLTGQWEDAEDALQEVFLRLASKAASIRRRGALRAWLYRTTLHCAADRLRLRRATVSLDEREAECPASAARIVAVESLRREHLAREGRLRESLLARVERLIPRLPERQAAVFALRFFQGLPHREIAAILEISEAGVKSLHSLACRHLRQWAAAEQEQADDALPARPDAAKEGRR